MEWDLKLPPWDLEGLERGIEPSIGLVVGSTRASGHHLGGQDCSVDLKLGASGIPFGKPKDQSKVLAAVMLSSSSGTSKRARAPLRNGSLTVSCLVDGCTSDLSKCREYHRRHKVCELHSKTAIVTVGGREQRFCQQCSRFHLLGEFDDAKRSCRKRLDGHNRRRRKPQPDFVSSGRSITNLQGTRYSAYPQIFPTVVPEPNWTRIVKSEVHHQPLHRVDRQQHYPVFSHIFREGAQFPFSQDGEAALSSRTTCEVSACLTEHKAILPSESSSSSSSSSRTKMFSDGITQLPDCALSLLSSPSLASGANLGHMMPTNRIPACHPLVSALQYGKRPGGHYSTPQASNTILPMDISCSGMEDGNMGAFFASDASNSDLHCQGIFHIGGEGSSDGTSQAQYSFSWQ